LTKNKEMRNFLLNLIFCFQALNLQSAIAEEAKEKSRQVAG